MSEEFKDRLIKHAIAAVERAPRAHNEAATSQYLVLPFLQLLGYDPMDPDEIVPEANASFAEKFKNRVDYAVCKDGVPAMAIECKKVGTLNEAHRGEIRGYFNAVPSVKLGILTDGLIFELYSDTCQENMMDADPFIVINLELVANGQITENALDALRKLRKDSFDPADVGADARRKLLVAGYMDALERVFKAPDEVFVRAMMDMAKVDARRTTRTLEEQTPIVATAIATFFDRKLLERVGFADRDVVRVDSSNESDTSEDEEEFDASPAAPVHDDGVVTTETELEVFRYVMRRLPFLIERDESLYAALQHVQFKDRKTVFCVFYKQERKGKLFNFTEGADPRLRFDFPHSEAQIATNNIADIDAELLGALLKRIEEMGL